MTERERRALIKTVRPFASVLGIVDALPEEHTQDEGSPLRDQLPGGWPSLGDLRALVTAVASVTKK